MNTIDGKLPLPLKGIRVLDATHIVAGPFCSLILADMGAEVIKIERPGTGDLSRGRGPFIQGEDGQEISSRYLGVNRNKKSVTLDLRNPLCKSAFENLVRKSDVLIDNWGPGAFERLGLGYKYLHELNPGLVYASITGYGDSEGLRGPYSNWPANNLSIQGMAGWMEVTGDLDGGPQAVGDNIGDSVPGLWTALGIVLALQTKQQTGQGQLVDMSMYECMVSHLISSSSVYQATGKNPTRSRARLVTAGMPFKAKDGYVLMAGVRSEERLRTMWQLLGRDDLAEDPRYLGKDPDGDFYFSNVIPAIEEWSQHLPKWEVAEKLTEIGFSMGIAQTISDLDQCPHLEARQMFVETDDTLGGRFRSLKTPIHLTDCEEFTADTPPLLGENNVEILCGIGGLSREQLSQLEEQGAV
ncbi:MAG: CoA transferase [Chloroflexi bacterium]|nr:CoA transferase [Chloroflexota bacterium]